MRSEGLFAAVAILIIAVVSASALLNPAGLSGQPSNCNFPAQVIAVNWEVRAMPGFVSASRGSELSFSSYSYEGPVTVVIIDSSTALGNTTIVVFGNTSHYTATTYPPTLNLNYFSSRCGSQLQSGPWMSVSVPQGTDGRYNVSAANYQYHAGYWHNGTTSLPLA